MPRAAAFGRGFGATLLLVLAGVLFAAAALIIVTALLHTSWYHPTTADVRDRLLVVGVGFTACTAAGVVGFWGSWLARNKATG
jgi:hypothetical protein